MYCYAPLVCSSCPGLTCAADEPLLDSVNPVPDSYFTAPSVESASYAAHNARSLDGAGGYWIASDADRNATPLTFFLQVCHVYIIRLCN